MASTPFKKARDLALVLPPTERAELAHDLLASLDGPGDADAAKAWEGELSRRLDDLEVGRAATLDADEALNRMDERLGRRG